MKFECGMCGYIYNPEKGDVDNKIPAGTNFREIDENYKCPICGADKACFMPERH